MYKVFSYRLYPTKAQERRLEQFCEIYCWWNRCVDPPTDHPNSALSPRSPPALDDRTVHAQQDV